MAHRTFFSREAIIETAFDLVRREGEKGLTIRNIAKELGCSTMPIYSSGLSIEEIEQEVKAKIWNMMQDYQGKPFTDNPLMNLSIGYVSFAQHEPNLFRFLSSDQPIVPNGSEAQDMGSLFHSSYKDRPDAQEAFAMVPKDIQNPLALNCWIFTHGLASLVANGMLRFSDEKIRALLEEAGGAFYNQQPGQGGEHE